MLNLFTANKEKPKATPTLNDTQLHHVDAFFSKQPKVENAIKLILQPENLSVLNKIQALSLPEFHTWCCYLSNTHVDVLNKTETVLTAMKMPSVTRNVLQTQATFLHTGKLTDANVDSMLSKIKDLCKNQQPNEYFRDPKAYLAQKTSPASKPRG